MMTDQAAKTRIELTSAIAPDLRWLSADRRRIKQILINLVSNALKFTPACGHVHVSVQLTPEGLELAVADPGIGIPEDIPQGAGTVRPGRFPAGVQI